MRLMSIERYTGIAVAAAVVLVLILRWRLASPPLRRALLPILVSGGVGDRAGRGDAGSRARSRTTGAPIKLQSAERLAFGLVPIAYLVGLFRARMGRVGVSDLIVELSRGLEPGRLRDAIARSLRDPSLRARVLDSRSGRVRGRGRTARFRRSGCRTCGDDPRAPRPEGRGARPRPGAERGSGVARRRLERSRARARERASPRGAARPARRGAGTRAPGSSRQASPSDGDSNGTCTTERSSASSRLPSICGWPRRRCTTTRPRPRRCSAGVGDDLKQALDELRELARGLHPAVLTDRGLAPALQSLANRSPFPVEITGVPAVRLPEPVEAALYYVVAESLTNAAKHSGATEGRVELSTTPETVVVEIRDNGSGGASMSGGRAARARRPGRGPRRRVPASEAAWTAERSSRRRCRFWLSPMRRRLRSDWIPGWPRGRRPRLCPLVMPSGGPDEGGDRVSRSSTSSRPSETEPTPSRRTDQATSKRRQVRRIVGEAHVHALADRQERPAVALASEEPVAPVRVLRRLRPSD